MNPTSAAAPLARALAMCLQDLPATAPVAVGVSGGADSVALATVAHAVTSAQGRTLWFFHVHHGLSADADVWADGVRRLGRALDVPVRIEQVRVALDAGDGMEAAARAARYEALARMAGEAGVRDILLAHHLDDQAETVMIRLLRGAGPSGMAAMAARRERDGVRYHRPWLALERAQILAHAVAQARALDVPLADDPSNRDARHARGTLRQAVLPAVAGHWPGYRHTLARFARHSAETAALLDEFAQADVAALAHDHPRFGRTLDLPGWRALGAARRALVLRRWLAEHGLPMPPEARLAQWVHQFDTAAIDRQVLVQHGERRLRVYRNRIMLEPRTDAAVGADAEPGVVIDTPLSWLGEPCVALAALGGSLWFDRVDGGVDPDWLAAGALRVGMRRGRERLRLHADRPSRSLKNLYQEAGIPAWERDRLPLLWRGATLVFAAGLGLDARAPRSACGVGLRWVSQVPGATQGLLHDVLPGNAG